MTIVPRKALEGLACIAQTHDKSRELIRQGLCRRGLLRLILLAWASIPGFDQAFTGPSDRCETKYIMNRRDVSARRGASMPAPEAAPTLLPRHEAWWCPVWRVLVSANHKEVGTLYSLLAFMGGCVGGVLSMFMGQQLMNPTHGFITQGNIWNLIITAHGLVMIFWFVMPALIGGIGNWFVPLMIGANDTAFPRLNQASFWLLALGFALVLKGLLGPVGQGPAFLLAALALAGLSFWLGAANFIVTILNMRAPGFGLHKMPLFCWAVLVASGLLLLAVPVLAGAVTRLAFDHSPLLSLTDGGQGLFARLFWFFGHPEAYIIILPAFGIMSQIISTFTGRPLRAHLVVAYALVAIGLVGFVVWAHRMFFPAGMGSYVNAAALLLAIPSAIPFIAWGATLYRAKVIYKTPVLWALGFMFLFLGGGCMGLVMALTGTHNNYMLVAHLHYVLSMGAAFAIFGGFYYWVGKISGRPYPEFWGKVHFWTFFGGVNLTFFPMLFSLNHEWAMVSACGALLSGLSGLVFVYVLFRVLSSGQRVAGNYWGEGATTLEWTLPSPVPAQTFKDLPSVR